MEGAEELDRELSSQKEKSIDQTYDDYSDNEVRVCFLGIGFAFFRPFCVICYCCWSQEPTDHLAWCPTTLFVRHIKVTYYTNSEVYANSSILTCATFCSCAHNPTCTRAKKNRQEAPDLQRELTWLEKLQGKLQGSASKLTPGHIYLLFVFLLPCVYIQMRYDASCKIQIPSVLPSLPPSLPAFLSVRVYNNLMDVRCSIYTMSIFMYYLYHVNVQLITYVREGSSWSSTCLRSAVAMACGNKGGNSAVTRSHEHMTYRSI